MTDSDNSLPAAVKAEWDTLRAELATRNAQNFQLLTGSVVAYTALLTLFITFAKEAGAPGPQGSLQSMAIPVPLYFIPFAIIFPSVYLILSNVHSSARIAGYIETFLEPKSDLQLESSLSRFYGRLAETRGRLLLPFEEGKVVFALFLGLGLLNAVMFFLGGDWTFLGDGLARFARPLILLTPFLGFVDAGRRGFGKRCGRQHYRDVWKAALADANLAESAEVLTSASS